MKPLSLCSSIVKRPALEFFVIMSLLIQYLTEYRGAVRYKKYIREYVSLPCKNADSTRGSRHRCTYKHHELLGMSPVYSVFKIFVCVTCSAVSDSLRPSGLYSLWGSATHGISQVRITGVSCRFLLLGIFPTQESNPCVLHFRQILYCLSGKPNNQNNNFTLLLDITSKGFSCIFA